MTTITTQEVELLANLMTRAGVNQYEALWANGFLNRLRALALELAPKPPKEEPDVKPEP